MKKYKKVVRKIYAVLAILVLLFTFTVNIMAESANYNFGATFGNTSYVAPSVLFSIDSADWNTGNTITYTASYSPIFSSMTGIPSLKTYTNGYPEVLDPSTGSNIESPVSFVFSTSNYLVDEDPSVLEYPDGAVAALCDMHINIDGSESSLSNLTVSASDFYLYLDRDRSFSQIEFTFNSADWAMDYGISTLDYRVAYSVSGDDTVYYDSWTSDDLSTISLFPYFSDEFSENLLEAYPADTVVYIHDMVMTTDMVGEYYSFSLSGSSNYCFYDFRSHDIVAPDPGPGEEITPIDPGIFADYTSWIGTAVGGFLDLEIAGAFTLGGILMVLVAFMITMWFLKVFAGG